MHSSGNETDVLKLETPATTEPVETVDDATNFLEVWFPDGHVELYDDPEVIAHDLQSGTLKGSFRARTLFDNEAENADNWVTISALGEAIPAIDGVLKPKMTTVWAWMFGGAVVGYFVKLIDTLYVTNLISGEQTFITALVVAFFVVSRILGVEKAIIGAGIALFFFLKSYNFQVDFGVLFSMIGSGLMANFFTMLVGAAFGGPIGMILGAIAGHFKSRKLSHKIELAAEGSRPYVLGILVPLAFLVAAIPAYIYFNFEILPDWLA